MNEQENTTGIQYLSFILREEHFAIEINKVREVLDVTTLTKIPRMPEYLSGVINLRGNVVPVVDLGYRLGMPSIVKTINTCIMIVEIDVDGEDESVPMGVLTDAVQEVLDLGAEDIEPTPKMGSGLNTEFIRGMGHHNDKFMILLDIDKVLTAAGAATIREMQAIHEQASEEIETAAA